MPDFLTKILAKIIFHYLRYWIIHRSDKYLARSLRLVRRVVYAFTGDQMALTAINEMMEIFEGGGRDCELARRMMKESTPEYAEAILRSLLKKD